MVLTIFILVLFSSKAMAFSVTAPEQVIVSDTSSFYVDIFNDSDKPLDLTVNFYSPLKSEVVAPKIIAPKAKATVKITLTNTKYNSSKLINSTVEVNLGGVVQKKEIELKFQEKSTDMLNGVGAFIGGIFTFGPIVEEISKFSLFEQIVFWFLVIIAVILVIAFVARVKNRV